MSKILILSFIYFSIVLASCSVSSPNNDSNGNITDNSSNEKPTTLKKGKTSFDSIVKCNGGNLFAYSESYFYYPDYGCIYSEKNQIGDVQVFLFPKNSSFIPNSLSEYDLVIDDVNELSVNKIKDNFNIFIRIIDKRDLVFTKGLDSPYYIKDDPSKSVYYFNGTWKLIDTKKDIDKNPMEFYSNFIDSKEKNNINYETADRSRKQSYTTKQLTRTYPKSQYETFNYDVNADDIKDKIISSTNDDNNLFQDDELYVLLGDGNNKYTLSLDTSNHTSDGGYFLSGILPRLNNSGFILRTYFSSRGYPINHYYYTYKNGSWYISATTIEGYTEQDHDYYCTDYTMTTVSEYTQSISASFGNDEELLQNCPPLPIKYAVKTEQAEILNEKFESRLPPNYYIKGDSIEAVSQNEDWVKVSYKNGTKFGWIAKHDLSPLVN